MIQRNKREIYIYIYIYISPAQLSFVKSFVQIHVLFKVRVPVGRFILELPAGMLDDDNGDFVGTAVREVTL